MSNLNIWFRGLRGKLLLMVLIPVSIIAGLSFLSLNSITSQQKDLQRISGERLKITTTIDDMRIQINAVGRSVWVAYGKAGDIKGREAAIEDARSRARDFTENADAYEKMPITEKARQNFLPVKQHRAKANEAAEAVIAMLQKNNASSDAEARLYMLANYLPNANKIVATLIQNQKIVYEVNRQVVESAEKNAQNVKATMTYGGAFGCLALFVIGFMIAQRLAHVLTTLTEKLGDASQQVGSASEELSAASQQLSSGATEGAASLEETVSSIEELTSMVKVNADHSSEGSTLSQTSSQSADDGEVEIKKLIEAMAEISKSSKKIEEIINVIDDIAFQTNLLALNPAVEAAAKDISGLIKESVNKTENGAQIADQSGAVLKNIVNSIKKVADLNGEIASASKQQAEGLGQISQAMTQLDTVTQQNAASAEEAAASSEELSAQAIVLREMVQNLVTIVQGGATSGAKPSFAPKAELVKSISLKKKPKLDQVDASNVIPFESKRTEPELAKTGTEGF